MNEPNYTQHHVPPPMIDTYFALEDGHCNWRGGLWPHGNYFVTHGLQRYGFDREARLLAEKSYEVSAPDKSVREWYNAETGEGLGGHELYAGAELLMRFTSTELETGFQPMLIEETSKPIQSKLESGPQRWLLIVERHRGNVPSLLPGRRGYPIQLLREHT